MLQKPERHIHLLHCLIIVTLVSICYYNALDCGFVFDDMSAVRDNKDLRPTVPVKNLFTHDFWGTPIHKEHSHKSYRPLCVLTFRLNYVLHQLQPWGYHFVNIALHVIVCLLYLRLCLLFLPVLPSFIAAILFAVHPVHTEAVTGVVGRAEILSSIFFLLAFLFYAKCCYQEQKTNWSTLFVSLLFIILATLSKEQGITVVGICCIYDVFILQKLKLNDMVHVTRSLVSIKSHIPLWLRHMFVRVCFLVASSAFLIVARLKIMGAQLPVFTKYDNPAAMSKSPARQLTYNYLLPVNLWLLMFPCDLCCDWTMGTIPLVESFLDTRNLATLAVYLLFALIVKSAHQAEKCHSDVVFMSLSLLILPFLPASNLFFPVGFVVAERVLYTPSMGFCLLVACGWHLLDSKMNCRILMRSFIMFLIFCYCLKTILRNYDWLSEEDIFEAGLRVNKRNAKLYNNVGHALESKGQFNDALSYFSLASEVQPDDIGAHINVGRTYNNLKMYKEAEEAFWKAKNLLPRPRPGEQYQARIAPSHLNVFLNLANLISRSGDRLEEADVLYRQAIGMRADYVQAYINRGDILIKLNRTHEALEVYEKALQFDSSNPDIYYNLGVVHLELNEVNEALSHFDKALNLDPEHEQSLMNSAILMQESGKPQLRKIAYERLHKLLKKGKVNERIYFNLGMLAMDDKEMNLAENWFKKAIQLKENFRSALFNLALLLSDARRPLEAVPFLKQLLQHHPEHVKGLILLGDIYINHIKDLDSAQKCYEKILILDDTNVQALHNLCVVYVERGLLKLAEKCLSKAAAMAPAEEYLQRHLRIIRSRLLKKQNLNSQLSIEDDSLYYNSQLTSVHFHSKNSVFINSNGNKKHLHNLGTEDLPIPEQTNLRTSEKKKNITISQQKSQE